MVDFGRRCQQIYSSFKENFKTIKSQTQPIILTDFVDIESKTQFEIEERVYQNGLNFELN